MNDPLLLESSLEELFDEQMEDIVEQFIAENGIDPEEIEKIEYIEVFPHDLKACPDSFETLLTEEMERLGEDEDLECAYQRAKERMAVIENLKQAKKILRRMV